MSISVLYTATATSRGGRDGQVKSDDGTIDLPLTMPKALGGSGAPGTNPEQLFASGYSACFGSALSLVGRMKKIDVGPFDITAKVSIGKTAAGGFGLSVELHGHFQTLSREHAQALMEAAHQVCPYSNATRNNIDVQLFVD